MWMSIIESEINGKHSENPPKIKTYLKPKNTKYRNISYVGAHFFRFSLPGG